LNAIFASPNQFILDRGIELVVFGADSVMTYFIVKALFFFSLLFQAVTSNGMHVQNRSENCSFLYFNISLLQNGNFNSYKIIVFDFQSILCSKDAMQLKNYKRRKKMHSVYCYFTKIILLKVA
jgi:hypothetical protein